MILTFLFQLWQWMLSWQIGLIPDYDLPAGIYSAVSTAVSYIWLTNKFLDVPTFFWMFETFLYVELLVLGLDFVFWVYAKVPVIGKR